MYCNSSFFFLHVPLVSASCRETAVLRALARILWAMKAFMNLLPNPFTVLIALTNLFAAVCLRWCISDSQMQPMLSGLSCSSERSLDVVHFCLSKQPSFCVLLCLYITLTDCLSSVICSWYRYKGAKLPIGASPPTLRACFYWNQWYLIISLLSLEWTKGVCLSGRGVSISITLGPEASASIWVNVFASSRILKKQKASD